MTVYRTTFIHGSLLLQLRGRHTERTPGSHALHHLTHRMACCSRKLAGLHQKRACILGTSSLIGISVLAPSCLFGLCGKALRFRRFYGSMLNVHPKLHGSVHFCLLFNRRRGCCSNSPSNLPTSDYAELGCLRSSRPLSKNISFNGVLSFIVNRRQNGACQMLGGVCRVPPK